MADLTPQPTPRNYNRVDWLMSSYDEQLGIVLYAIQRFDEVDEDIQTFVETFIIDYSGMQAILPQDFFRLIRTNKDFRDFFRARVEYLCSANETIIEDEEVALKYYELTEFLLNHYNDPNLDPHGRFYFIVNNSKDRHQYGGLEITDEVYDDLINLRFEKYSGVFFDNFRKLLHWFLLDILDHFESLESSIPTPEQ